MFTNVRLSTFVVLLLLASRVGSFSLSYAEASPVAHNGIATQEPQRERRATPNASPSQTPASSQSQSDALTPTPTPAPSPTPVVPATSTTRTLAELQARISEVLRKPQLSPAIVGIKIVSADSGKVLFEENSQKLLRPASNMKLYTVAAALDRLSPDYRFVTSVYAPARPDAAGVVHGDLTVYGRGDPSIAARFNEGNYFKAINELAARIVAAGVKRVEGDLVGDETYFVGPQYGSGWEWEDLQWWYGAEVTSLSVNDNAVDLSIKPGLQVGAPAVITTGPPNPLLTIVNRVVTGERRTKRELNVYRGLASDQVEITGSMAIDDGGYTGGLGISRPALLFAYLLRASLAERGVLVTGKTRTIGPLFSTSAAQTESAHPAGVEVAALPSPPFSVIAAQTMKPSQNLYTELILRTLGKVVPPTAATTSVGTTSETMGLEVIKAFLKEAGVNPAGLRLNDGSGLSRSDMVTAEATIQLLTYMRRHRHGNAFRDSLPIAGVDGTLRNRMKGTRAENNLRAKTGSLSSAASLSGFVTTAAGEELIFSIMVNNYAEDIDPRATCIDPISVLLASFAGRTQLS